MSWHVSPWVYLIWDSLCLLDLINYFLFHVGDIFNYNLFKNFLIPFLFLFFWDPYNSNVGTFDIVPEVSETILSSFHSFYFILLFRSYLGDPGSIPGSGKIPWRRKWQPTPVLLPGESHGGRSLVGYSPWGRKESDMTELLHFHSIV